MVHNLYVLFEKHIFIIVVISSPYHDNLFMVNDTYSVLNNNQLSQLLPGLHDISYPLHGFIAR